jgi:hypothetical protein
MNEVKGAKHNDEINRLAIKLSTSEQEQENEINIYERKDIVPDKDFKSS